MLGPDISKLDLYPVFIEMLNDVDEVRSALIQHAADFILVCSHSFIFIHLFENQSTRDH